MQTSDERLKIIIEIWKKTVDVQQHFNDLSLRIRNFALTIFTFIIGAVGYLLKENIHVSFGSLSLPASSLTCYLGVLVLLAFYIMDRYWYHNLLVGAVKHGVSIEQTYKSELKELALATAIGDNSPNKILGIKFHSKHKLSAFYLIIFGTLIILGTVLLRSSPSPKVNQLPANSNLEITINSHNTQPKLDSVSALRKVKKDNKKR